MTTKILFVCLGNICRSPTAEGIMRHLCSKNDETKAFVIDSCGTSGWHNGEPPDGRMQALAKQHGVDISQQQSRKLCAADFNEFDYILCMDQSNYDDSLLVAPRRGYSAQLLHFMTYVTDADGSLDCPDPYYFGANDQAQFFRVWSIIHSGCANFLDTLINPS